MAMATQKDRGFRQPDLAETSWFITAEADDPHLGTISRTHQEGSEFNGGHRFEHHLEGDATTTGHGVEKFGPFPLS